MCFICSINQSRSIALFCGANHKLCRKCEKRFFNLYHYSFNYFSPNEDFNFGIALTSRPLNKDEHLEVQIEEIIDKWAGSLEIGVTTHAPGTFSLPGTMTNVTSGTWMFSGGAIVHNGVTILEAYGRNTVSYKVFFQI